MPTSRTYQSPLREAQAALTRERILMAAKTYLEHNNIETLSLRQLAELAGVSPPTVYAHFATVDDLVAAFFQWLRTAARPAEGAASARRLRRAAQGAVLELPGLPRAVAQPDEQAVVGPSARRGRRAAPRPLDRRGGRGPARPDARTAPARRHGGLRLLVADRVALADGHLRLHPEGGRAGRVLGGRRARRRPETRSIGPRRRAPDKPPSKVGAKECKR